MSLVQNKGYSPKIITVWHTFEPKQVAPHSHTAQAVLIYLHHGTADLTIGGQAVCARSGALIAVNPGVRHGGSYHASERSGKLERYAIGLSDLERPGLAAGCLIAKDIAPVMEPDLPQILPALFELLEREFITQEPGHESVCGGVLQALLTIMDRASVSAVPVQQTAPHPSQQLAADILAYLRVHYCENITLQNVADCFYISPSYLSHLVKKHTGVPLMQYVIHQRMHEAQALLRDTEYPVKQIGRMVGYENFNYFLNVFKKVVGCSPGQYRARSL